MNIPQAHRLALRVLEEGEANTTPTGYSQARLGSLKVVETPDSDVYLTWPGGRFLLYTNDLLSVEVPAGVALYHALNLRAMVDGLRPSELMGVVDQLRAMKTAV